MPDTACIRDVMSAAAVTFRPDDTVEVALRRLLDLDASGGPVIDADGKVVGMLTDGDLIVQEAEVPTPTALGIFGALLQSRHRREEFDEQVQKAFGTTVAELMEPEVIVCNPDDTVEQAATVMHEHDISRLPVVDADGTLLGLVTRRDLLRHLLASYRPEGSA